MAHEWTIDVPARDLVLGDVVKVMEGAWGWATVVRIEEDVVHLFRPYVHVGDFSYTGGVLHYIGSETFSLIRDSGRSYTVDASTHKHRVGEGVIA